MATPAVPGRRKDRRHRFGRQWSSRSRGRGTLMRHFLNSSPIAALPLGMRVTTAQARLIAAAGGAHGVVACLVSARRGAVAVAAIAVAADDDGGPAAGAQVASSGRFHWQSGPMESRRQRALREILCRQRCPRCGAAGRGIGSDLAVGTGVAPTSPPAGRLSTASATDAHLPPHCPTGSLSEPYRPVINLGPAIPFLPRFACQTTIAAQFVRREPCGRQGTPA